MKRTFAFGAATNQGQWPVQEDGFFVDPVRGVFALADGFGGRGQGDIAAKMALGEARAQLGAPALAAQRELFSSISHKLAAWNEKRAVAARAGCSFLFAAMGKGQELLISNSGACAAMLLRGQQWMPLLTPQASPRAYPSSPLLPQEALGLSAQAVVETRIVELVAGDLVFLFSSGLCWESPALQAELLGRLALREPGGSLAELARFLAELPEEPATWNRTVLLLEATP